MIDSVSCIHFNFCCGFIISSQHFVNIKMETKKVWKNAKKKRKANSADQ